MEKEVLRPYFTFSRMKCFSTVVIILMKKALLLSKKKSSFVNSSDDFDGMNSFEASSVNF